MSLITTSFAADLNTMTAESVAAALNTMTAESLAAALNNDFLAHYCET